MDKPETIADIIAEMRRLAKEIRDKANDTFWDKEESKAEDLEYDADRLEAAHKREVATTKESLAVGNSGDCAKLREALVRCRNCAQMIPPFVQASKPDRSSLNAAADYANLILQDVADGLAAPPRNCDRFGGDIDKLREACARERGLNPEEDFPDVFPDWLLAPATEKEGGNDADK